MSVLFHDSEVIQPTLSDLRPLTKGYSKTTQGSMFTALIDAMMEYAPNWLYHIGSMILATAIWLLFFLTFFSMLLVSAFFEIFRDTDAAEILRGIGYYAADIGLLFLPLLPVLLTIAVICSYLRLLNPQRRYHSIVLRIIGPLLFTVAAAVLTADILATLFVALIAIWFSIGDHFGFYFEYAQNIVVALMLQGRTEEVVGWFLTVYSRRILEDARSSVNVEYDGESQVCYVSRVTQEEFDRILEPLSSLNGIAAVRHQDGL